MFPNEVTTVISPTLPAISGDPGGYTYTVPPEIVTASPIVVTSVSRPLVYPPAYPFTDYAGSLPCYAYGRRSAYARPLSSYAWTSHCQIAPDYSRIPQYSSIPPLLHHSMPYDRPRRRAFSDDYDTWRERDEYRTRPRHSLNTVDRGYRPAYSLQRSHRHNRLPPPSDRMAYREQGKHHPRYVSPPPERDYPRQRYISPPPERDYPPERERQRPRYISPSPEYDYAHTRRMSPPPEYEHPRSRYMSPPPERDYPNPRYSSPRTRPRRVNFQPPAEYYYEDQYDRIYPPYDEYAERYPQQRFGRYANYSEDDYYGGYPAARPPFLVQDADTAGGIRPPMRRLGEVNRDERDAAGIPAPQYRNPRFDPTLGSRHFSRTSNRQV